MICSSSQIDSIKKICKKKKDLKHLKADDITSRMKDDVFKTYLHQKRLLFKPYTCLCSSESRKNERLLNFVCQPRKQSPLKVKKLLYLVWQ